MRKHFLGYEDYSSQEEIDAERDRILALWKATGTNIQWKVVERVAEEDDADEFWLYVRGKTLRDKWRVFWAHFDYQTESEWKDA